MSMQTQEPPGDGGVATITEPAPDRGVELSPAAEQRRRRSARKQVLSTLKFELNDARKVASREWYRLAFADHPYGRPIKGTLETIAGVTPADLRAYTRRVLARDTLKVAVVGDIDAETLGALLDKVFGGLPAGGDLVSIPEAATTAGLDRYTEASREPMRPLKLRFVAEIPTSPSASTPSPRNFAT